MRRGNKVMYISPEYSSGIGIEYLPPIGWKDTIAFKKYNCYALKNWWIAEQTDEGFGYFSVDNLILRSGIEKYKKEELTLKLMDLDYIDVYLMGALPKLINDGYTPNLNDHK